jgi:hypothetical protein
LKQIAAALAIYLGHYPPKPILSVDVGACDAGHLEKILTIQNDPVTCGDLAALYEAEHKNGLAMDLLQQAVLEIHRARLALDCWRISECCNGNRDCAKKVRKTLRGALGETEASVGPDHPDTARIPEQYGEVLRRTGRKAEAKKAADRAVAIRVSSASQRNENGFTVDWLDSRQRQSFTESVSSVASSVRNGNFVLVAHQPYREEHVTAAKIGPRIRDAPL